ANMLKWIWWRFNSYGYFWGMAAGMLAAGFVPQITNQLAERGMIASRPAEIFLFPAILLISLVGCFAGTLLTPPDDVETLKRFYLRVRPWGFWRPIHKLVAVENPKVLANRDFKRDFFNVVVGMVWQVALTATGIYIVIRDYE